MKTRTVLLLTAFLVLLLACACTYLGISAFYSDHFLPGTSINGIDVSGKTDEEAEQAVAEQAEKYHLILQTAAGSEETIAGGEIGYHFVRGDETAALLKEQPALLWLLAGVDRGPALSVSEQTDYDEALLHERILSLACMQAENTIKTEDAHIERQEDGTYVVVKEVQGTEIDAARLETAVKNAVDAGTTKLFLEDSDCYVRPAVTETDAALNAKAATLNKYSSVHVTYLMGGDVKEELGADVTSSWLSLSGDGQPVFDEEKAAAWVQQLADRYDTIGTFPPFITSNQEEVYPESRTYGWLMDREAETEALLQILRSGTSAEREPVWLESAAARGKNDIGDTYVEIDYTNQRLWYYKDGRLLVETPVVTGNVSLGQNSPEGIFCITGKEENAILKGEGYETPVRYWMPFYEGVGIHDADSWRSEYGGTIYQYSGSHGCINTPTAQAAVIFSQIEEGTPVICYRSSYDYGYETVTVTGQSSAVPWTGGNAASLIPDMDGPYPEGTYPEGTYPDGTNPENSYPGQTADSSYWEDALNQAQTDSTVLVVP